MRGHDSSRILSKSFGSTLRLPASAGSGMADMARVWRNGTGLRARTAHAPGPTTTTRPSSRARLTTMAPPWRATRR